MAVYQFPMTVVPIDFNSKEESNDFWKGSKLNNKIFINTIIEELNDNFESSRFLPNTITFGKENGLKIDFMTDSNGLVDEIFIRIHVTYLKESLPDIKKLVSIFGKYDVFAWTGNNTKIEFDYESILKEIEESNAFKFVLNPLGYLDEIRKNIPRSE